MKDGLKHMKAGEPTSVPRQRGELLDSQFYEVEQLSIAYPDKRTFLWERELTSKL